jgi:DNA modification methylase
MMNTKSKLRSSSRNPNAKKTFSRNPNAKKTLKRLYPLYRKYSGKKNADIAFLGSCSVEVIDNVLGMDDFHKYEKANQNIRRELLIRHQVPLEFEEIIRLKQPGRKHFKIDFDTSRIKMINEKLLTEWENKVICMDCVEAMSQLPDKSADLFVFSPPYDTLRTYNGKPEFDLHKTGEQVFRLLKDGGICAMVIQDQTKNFGKSLTSFKTIVDWVESFGFKLFECIIYHKNGTEGAWWKKRFRVDHEYIPLFLKGDKPAYFNKEGLKVPSKHGGKIMSGFASRKTDGTTQPTVTKMINPTKCRGTVWDYMCAGDKNPIKRRHPAPFPDKIPYDIIQCFCPEGGLVVDPFMGSGSTAVAAIKLNRKFMGFDISEEYIDQIANERIKVSKPEEASLDKEGGIIENASAVFQTMTDILDSDLSDINKNALIEEILKSSHAVQEKFAKLNQTPNGDNTNDCQKRSA